MDKKTKIKVTIITIIGVVVALIYINRGQLIADFKLRQRAKEWEKNAPTGELTNGRKNGKWTTTYKNGQLESEESYLMIPLMDANLFITPAENYISRETT